MAAPRAATTASSLSDAVRPHGTVVAYTRPGNEYSSEHERCTRLEIARRLAILKDFEFAGEFDPSRRYAGPLYLVPNDTLVQTEAQRLGICGEPDLFGGVVPHAFVATKSISHPLVAPDARAPTGWSHDFQDRVRDGVLPGFSAFALDDACRAGQRLLANGPVRIKPVHATGGRGQAVVMDVARLRACLESMDAAELSRGVVLEQNLEDVTTYSVGQVRVADLVASYHGRQCLTTDNTGAQVYGGSDLQFVRGGFEALLASDLPDEVRGAVMGARAYDCAANACFAGLFASRRNYDVIHGRDRHGHRRCGVLEQSWRAGGASGAEIAALEAFRAEPGRQAVRARCVEVFGQAEAPPSHATVYFRGIDDRAGPLTKYTLVEPHGHA